MLAGLMHGYMFTVMFTAMFTVMFAPVFTVMFTAIFTVMFTAKFTVIFASMFTVVFTATFTAMFNLTVETWAYKCRAIDHQWQPGGMLTARALPALQYTPQQCVWSRMSQRHTRSSCASGRSILLIATTHGRWQYAGLNIRSSSRTTQ